MIAFPIIGHLDYVQRISENMYVSFQFKVIPDNKQHEGRADVSV